jgi:hypothetical protein
MITGELYLPFISIELLMENSVRFIKAMKASQKTVFLEYQ